MSKDYKDNLPPKKSSKSNLKGYVLTYLLGVFTGVAIALWLQYKFEHPEKATASTETSKGTQKNSTSLTAPEFDFYQLLPEMEVEVQEYSPEQTTTDLSQDGIKEHTLYGIQVGAFRQHQDAESLQAQLALVGFEPYISIIQSVKSKWYRVRVGPYKSLRELDKYKRILEKNGFNAMRIQLVK